MGVLKYISGDLLETTREALAHSVNIAGAFGAGVARQVADCHPEARDAYLARYRRGQWKLGDIQVVACEDRWVFNLAGQATYGRKGRHVDYDALGSALGKCLSICEKQGWGLAIPKLGAGLGGGDWDVIEGLLIEALLGRDVEVDVHTL